MVFFFFFFFLGGGGGGVQKNPTIELFILLSLISYCFRHLEGTSTLYIHGHFIEIRF